MSDRRDLQEELNKINQMYQEKDLEMRKAGATPEQREKLKNILNKKKEELVATMGDSLQNLNKGKDIVVSGGTLTKGMDPSSIIDATKESGLGKFKKTLGIVGKKAAGIIPLAGVGMAISNSPGTSASELMQDPKVQRAALSEIAGPIGDAIDLGGDAVEWGLDKHRDVQDRKAKRIIEKEALENYKNSPAARNRLGLEALPPELSDYEMSNAYKDARGVQSDEESDEIEKIQKKPRFNKLRDLFDL